MVKHLLLILLLTCGVARAQIPNLNGDTLKISNSTVKYSQKTEKKCVIEYSLTDGKHWIAMPTDSIKPVPLHAIIRIRTTTIVTFIPLTQK